MIHLFNRSPRIASLAVLVSLAAIAAKPLAESLTIKPVAAQATKFEIPASLPADTKLRIGGSSTMTKVTEAIKTRFEQKFKGAQVEVGELSTDAALKDVVDGKLDVAATGRPLTPDEEAKGLVEVPLTRNKIAIVVSPDSPYKGDITIDQFAKIFRGEITDWSQISKTVKGPVRVIDRPDTSDTRRAFQNYPVFQSAPLKAGAGAKALTEDSTDAVVKELGRDGVGYAIADQVLKRDDVKVLSMYKTTPDNPKYPFSQALGYAYKANPNPAVQAFLGYALNPENRAAIEQARTAAVTAAPSVVPSVETSPTPQETVAQTPAVADTPERGFPWWILPLAGLPLLWFLFKDRETTPAAAPVRDISAGRIILTPRDCRNAYAYWEVPQAAKDALREHGGRDLKLRLHDVTDLNMAHQKPHSTREFDCNDREPDLHVPIPVDNRDYLVELGSTNREGEWLSLCRSEPVRVPACVPTGEVERSSVAPMAAAGAVATGAAAVASRTFVAGDRAESVEPGSRIILTPRTATAAYVYWEISDEHKAAMRQAGGRDLRLRLYDVTGGIDVDRQAPHSVQEYDCSEVDPDLHLSINDRDRDYVVELGYITKEGRWLKLARSAAVHVPAASSTEPKGY